MSGERPIKPERITKPIQLLGAWLAGLLAIDTCFLVAAAKMPAGSWHTDALVVAAIANVPLFLVAVFLLQTRFRPELQEDSYYSTYLSNKTNQLFRVGRGEELCEIKRIISDVEARVLTPAQDVDVQKRVAPDLSGIVFGVNQHLDDILAIQTKLKERGIMFVSVFGGAEPPIGRNVSISVHLPKDVAKTIVALSAELGFTTYNFWDNAQERAEEQVLFGSYGEGKYLVMAGT